MRNKKFIAALFALFLVFITAFVPVSAKEKPTLNKTAITLKEGQTYQLKLKNIKARVTWKSKNKSVATVSSSGKVTAKKHGSTIIQAKCAGKTYQCKVKVKKTYLSQTELTLDFGTEKKIELKNAPFKVAWFSSDTKIAYSRNGIIEARSVGTAIITAKCGGKSYMCTVHVLSGEDETLKEDGIYTSKDKVAEYIHTYGKLPSNFITKTEANKLGWTGGSLITYDKYKCIGGDEFHDTAGRLDKTRIWYECDINTLGALERGAERLVYSSDGMIYYTADHYDTLELLYSAAAVRNFSTNYHGNSGRKYLEFVIAFQGIIKYNKSSYKR